MKKVFKNLILELKRCLKTDLKKLISVLLIYYISMIIPTFIFAFIMAAGLKEETKQRRIERNM